MKKQKPDIKSEYLKKGDFTIEKMRQLSFEEQDMLCKELRDKIVSVVSENGGHMASNLGTVELTVGLYNVFDPFKDKIIWDVGHQTYTHKILTGRCGKFDTIRTEGGLSGFPKREESEADAFNTGHSSTSVSAAVGMARAAKITGEDYKVVAVIGDGAMTGGQAFEAVNDAAGHDDNVIIVLNDNGMSISKNVGGMSRYLGRVRTRKSYIKLKKGVKKLISAIPFIGTKIVKRIQKIKLSVKMLFIPGEIFEMLGLMYIGPVDGHNIKAVTEAMKKADKAEKPVLVHVITKKGRGFEAAEKNPENYHGVSGKKSSDEIPKDYYTGKPLSYSKTFGESLCKLGESDQRVAAISAAMPLGTKLDLFAEKFPDRFFDVGIAEQHAVTMGAAMSLYGVRPYLVLYSTFAQRAYDQLLHDCALQKANMVIGLDRGGIAGSDGETHQGIYDIAFLRTIPETAIFAPCCCGELAEIIKYTGRMYDEKIHQGPFVIRYPAKNIFKEIENIPEIQFGKAAEVLEREDYEVSFVALGVHVNTAFYAGKILEKAGVKANVINGRFAKPIDTEGIIKMTEKAGIIVTIEDGIVNGGFGEALGKELADRRYLNGEKRIINLGYPDEAVLQGTVKEIYERYGLTPEKIAENVLKIMGKY